MMQISEFDTSFFILNVTWVEWNVNELNLHLIELIWVRWNAIDFCFISISRNSIIDGSRLLNLRHSTLFNLTEHEKAISVQGRCLPVHFEVIVVFIVIEIHIWLSISFIDVLELISIALRDDISETIRPGSSSIMGSIVEAASNVGLNLVVVSLINVRWFVICFSSAGKKIKKKEDKKVFVSIIDWSEVFMCGWGRNGIGFCPFLLRPQSWHH